MNEPLNPRQTGDPASASGQRSLNMIAFAAISLVSVFLVYQVGGGLLTFVALGDITVSPENVQTVRLVTLLSQLLFILGPTIILTRYLGDGWRSIFPMRFPSWSEFALGVIGLLCLQRVLETVIFLQQQIPLPDILQKLIEPIKEMLQKMIGTLLDVHSTPELFFVVVVVAVVPALVEELYFRGLIQHLFSRALSPLGGALAAGVIFGLFHLNPFDALGLIGLGMFFGFVRYRSASMLLPITLHFLNNALAVAAVRFGLKNDEMLVQSLGQMPGMGMMLLQGFVFGLLFVWVLLSYRRSTAAVAGVQ